MNYDRAIHYAEQYLGELETEFEVVAEQYRALEQDVEGSRIHVASLRRRREETVVAKPAVAIEDMPSMSQQIREAATDILKDTPDKKMHRTPLRKMIQERGIHIGGDHKDTSVSARLGKDPLGRFKSLGKGVWQLIQPESEVSSAPASDGQRELVAGQGMTAYKASFQS